MKYLVLFSLLLAILLTTCQSSDVEDTLVSRRVRKAACANQCTFNEQCWGCCLLPRIGRCWFRRCSCF
ncbi:hypothetical protein MTP99_002663 [Tenebrio molitor]|nr:hypothetical protein MTP99_002663 [Tenebrio molitor]